MVSDAADASWQGCSGDVPPACTALVVCPLYGPCGVSIVRPLWCVHCTALVVCPFCYFGVWRGLCTADRQQIHGFVHKMCVCEIAAEQRAGTPVCKSTCCHCRQLPCCYFSKFRCFVNQQVHLTRHIVWQVVGVSCSELCIEILLAVAPPEEAALCLAPCAASYRTCNHPPAVRSRTFM
jgi:hypothetical protein